MDRKLTIDKGTGRNEKLNTAGLPIAGSSLQLEPGVSQTSAGREISGSGYKPEPAGWKKGGYPPPEGPDFGEKEN
jgi:hypothetical protein